MTLSQFQISLKRSTERALILSFCLHDQSALTEILHLIKTCSPEIIIAWDLTPGDLPRLTELLRSAFGRRPGQDPREQLAHLGQDCGLLASYSLVRSVQRHEVRFPSFEAVLSYIGAFDLLQGNDLGLDITKWQAPWPLITEILVRQAYPFVDVREFGCIMGRRDSR